MHARAHKRAPACASHACLHVRSHTHACAHHVPHHLSLCMQQAGEGDHMFGSEVALQATAAMATARKHMTQLRRAQHAAALAIDVAAHLEAVYLKVRVSTACAASGWDACTTPCKARTLKACTALLPYPPHLCTSSKHSRALLFGAAPSTQHTPPRLNSAELLASLRQAVLLGLEPAHRCRVWQMCPGKAPHAHATCAVSCMASCVASCVASCMASCVASCVASCMASCMASCVACGSAS